MTEESSNKINKFDQGSTLKVIIVTALPIIVFLTFNALYTLVDTMLASTLVDYGTVIDDGVVNDLNGGTSMGVIVPWMSILMALPTAFSVGGGLAYTQSLARNDKVDAKNKFDTAFTWIFIAVFISFSINLLFFIPYLLASTGNLNAFSTDLNYGHNWEEHTRKMTFDGYGYAIMITISFLFMNINQLLMRRLRTEGQTIVPTLLPILSLPINLGLDYVLMNEHIGNMGLIGAGIATLIASIFITTLLFIYYLAYVPYKTTALKLTRPSISVGKTITIIVFMFGVSSMFRRLFDAGINISMASTIDNLGVGWHNAMTAMTRSMNMVMTVTLGIGQTLAMLAAHYYNSGNKVRFKESIKYGILTAIILQVVLALIFILIQEWIFIGFAADWPPGWNWDLRLAYTLIMIYVIISSIQLIPPMFYAATKSVKKSIIHTTVYGLMTISSLWIGFAITKSVSQHSGGVTDIKDNILFASLVLGSAFGATFTSLYFTKWSNHTLKNSKRLNQKIIYNY